MTYSGDYYNSYIYGTLNNNKINVTTADDANFLFCNLRVVYNQETWSHDFEIPFFNNKAEFSFENYIHSIITQKFNLPTFNQNTQLFYGHDLATVTMTLKEMQQNVELDLLIKTFSMFLGNQTEIPISYLDNGSVRLLQIPQSKYVTTDGILCFSFLSKTLPTALIINDGVNNQEISLPTTFTSTKQTIPVPPWEPYLHTFTVPVKNIVSQLSTALSLSLIFQDTTLALGTFNIVDQGLDHKNIIYQNESGTISSLEFLGEYRIFRDFKADVFSYIDAGNQPRLTATQIDLSFPISINTGYVLDEDKYEMLFNLLMSYNQFVLNNTLERLVVNRSHKLKPYRTNYYQNNETLKFKKATNDDIHHRIY